MVETLVVTGITLGAAAYCVRHFRKSHKAGGGGACSGCDSCGTKEDAKG